MTKALREFRLRCQQRLTENQAEEAALLAELERRGEGDLTPAHFLRLRMAVRNLGLVLLSGREDDE